MNTLWLFYNTKFIESLN